LNQTLAGLNDYEIQPWLISSQTHGDLRHHDIWKMSASVFLFCYRVSIKKISHIIIKLCIFL